LTLLWSSKEAIFKWWGNGDVDFSKMIRLEKFEMQGKGFFKASFQETPLQIEYEMFDKLCLAWVITVAAN
ncbi:MAG: 4-phosphopantetheinyl transferase family protein, partial [Chitinophagaceae bacterium]|nr:4-phosphopantetheinyl transferase family protein [Chitinophagaceae bacterium]